MNQPASCKNLNRLINRSHSSPEVNVYTRANPSLRMLIVLFGFLLLFFLPQTVLSAGRTTVLYPELASPYRDVFETILKGIEATSKNEIIRYPLAADYQLQQLQANLSTNQSDGIISLGKRAYLAVKKLNNNLPTVFGALSIVPNGISGISLSADPNNLFARLKSLVPNSKRIFVVYSQKNTGWLIPLAKQAAANHGLQLLTYPAENLREAMHHYRALLKETQHGTDAIWLPLDKVSVNDDVVLPMLLQQAWDKNLAIISNKPAHAQRGVLFAMYPDNHGLGQELAKLLEQQVSQQPSQIIPLKRLQLAVNLRTAAHLELNFTLLQQEDFTLTFPSR